MGMKLQGGWTRVSFRCVRYRKWFIFFACVWGWKTKKWHL